MAGLLRTQVVLLALLVCAAAEDATSSQSSEWTPADKPSSDDQACRAWFYSIKSDMMRCQAQLGAAAAPASAPAAAPAVSADGPDSTAAGQAHHATCPSDCRITIKEGKEPMPSFCMQYVNKTLPAKYTVENESALMGPTFDVCESILCPHDTCDERIVDPGLIDALGSFFWLSDPGNPMWDPASGGISVGAIVGIVFACNLGVVAAVTAVVLVVRRRKRQRQLQQGSERAARQGRGKSAAAMEAGFKDKDGSGVAGAAGSDVSNFSKLCLSSLPSSPTASISQPSLTASQMSPVGTALARPPQQPGAISLSLPPPAAPRSDVGAGPLPHADGLQGVAALWANALQTTGGGSGPRTPPPGASAVPGVLTQHMQQDELEMMQLASNPASTAAATDPSTQLLLSYVASRQQQQQQQQQQQPGAAAEGGLASGGELQQPLPADSKAGQQGSQAARLAGGDGRVPRPSDGLAARGSSALIDLQPWRIDFSSLQIMRPLGEGSYGKVYLARWNETLVAVKVLVSGSGHQQGADAAWSVPQAVLDALEKEAQVMATLRHPNIVQFLGICSEPPAIVTEYASHGSLLDVLRGAGQPGLTWVRRLSMALDAAKGMLALHAHNPPILHRDLKSANLLVDSAWKAKVADFNLSKIMDLDAALSSTAHGMLNPRWLAPEVLRGERATAKSDVFSMGVVLWELLTFQIPWEREGRNSFQLVHMISSGERLQVPPRDSAPGPEQLSEADYVAYVALLQRCWAQEPAERPGFDQVISQLRSILANTLASSGSQAEGGPALSP
ncbi:hypothetical protein ABPG75_001985 [Micractinium tetrahymenae]